MVKKHGYRKKGPSGTQQQLIKHRFVDKISILLVDNLDTLRIGRHALLKSQNNIEIVGKASSGKMAMEIIMEISPNIVLTDNSLPDISGIQLAELLSINYPDVSVIVHSIWNNENIISKVLSAGAKGFLIKDADEVELIKAIRDVARGKTYISLPRDISASNGSLNGDLKALSEREKEVLKLIVGGCLTKEIADILFLSKRTIDRHRINISRKLKARNTADIVRIAIINNLLEK